jgi:metal-dependent amidase/aminoacylase/carboxypeptidase family protein
MIHNKKLIDLYTSNLASIQTEKVPSSSDATLGSTDMGNVSHVVPSIHPIFYMGGTEVNHTTGFTKEAGTVNVILQDTGL